MPNFKKTEHDLTSQLDKWLYFIKHLEDFQSIPQIFKGEHVFEKAFEKAELAKFTPREIDSYENSLKIYRDLKNVIDTARDEGEARGILRGSSKRAMEIAAQMKIAGEPIDKIVLYTNLTKDVIERL